MVLKKLKSHPALFIMLSLVALVLLSNCANPIVEAVMDIRNSTKASLSAITLTSGTLSPAFNPDTLNYSVVVEQSVSSITLSATRVDDGAAISFNPGQIVVLNEGSNTVTATVTPEGGTSRIYTLNVIRTPSPPTISVTGAGITRTVTLTKPASCPAAAVYYTTNGVDAGNPMNRIPYTGSLTVAGLGVQVEVRAVAVVNSVDSSVASTTTTPKIAYTGLTIGTTFTTPVNLPQVDAATAIGGTTIYYSDDMGSVKKYNISTTTSEVIAGVPWIAPMLDSAGHGVDARFNRIRDIVSDGINIYVLTNKSILKLNLSTFDVTIVASLPGWATDSILNAATDGTYIYFNGLTLYGYLGSIKISDGSYAQIGSHDIPSSYFTSLAWDGANLHCTVYSGYLAVGRLQTYTYSSGTSFSKTDVGNLSQAFGPCGIVVTGSQSYIAYCYRTDYSSDPIRETVSGLEIGIRPTNRMFTDGVYVYGFGNHDVLTRRGALYRLQ